MPKGTDHSIDAGAVPATASAVVLPEGLVPEWIKLFDYGTSTGRDGRGPYILRDVAHAAQVVAATVAYQAGADLPIDYDHQTQRALLNGKPAIAAGWIKELDARPDGLWVRVEWTGPAAQSIELKEFRYISPTFWGDGPNSTGNVTRIVGAGLTNLPNLTIPAIANQGAPMDPEQLKALALALGLPAIASQTDVLAAVQDLAAGKSAVCKILGIPETTAPDQLATAAQGAMATIATALKVTTGETTVPVLATAAQAIAASAATPDLTKYVPKDLYLATASQLTALQGQVTKSDVERAVAAAITAGKITPAQKDWALATASQDLDGFKSFVATAPVLVATAGQTTTAAPPPATGQQLTTEQLAVASQLGLSADEYAKHLAKEGK